MAGIGSGTMTRAAPSRERALRWALALAIVLGTFVGVAVTTALALVLAAPRIMSSGLQPLPEHAALRWIVSPEVSGVVTQLLLLLLAAATLALAALVATGARHDRARRAYAVWAGVGGALTGYALLANWSLAREAGLLAFAVGAGWSAFVGLAIVRLARRRAAAP